ncbi:DUF2306 domain-containing protein [Elizabethkingia anophelis]|uniref:DUF2306 domain-containing protein n=1 Tax=Elizabethkingia anophelis TaxID=1117645 RepID=UPI000994E0A6|nr:DUF2306 domain-containing protein [Elizabethkingia anophelis]AQW94737.1 hypothetical protein BBD30_11380 [Elizabethkingia anophelis]MCL1691934.1 DUF2306 domain-containing protein [Elizabethkingia anophelis]MDV3508527.1 DUF2306 domain-containing protein [Elizabethkingia anophelis]MDV3541071.1 DUF2306 domain-containing protein [Elizabethkingia anophelis]MDV3751008.1 DUF2306 domain-containing protein [Elizabethkingia anophelis]
MRKFLFVIVSIFAFLIGIYPFMYAFVDHKHTFLGSKTPEVFHNTIWQLAFYNHIIFGGLSLFIGWRQFGKKFRDKHIKLHRNIGKLYVISVIISSVAGIYMGFYANGGIISSTGFILLGIIWFSTTVIALSQIKKGNIKKHQQLMTYSYACTFAAVTLRLWLPLLTIITKDPAHSYLVVAWLSWIPNLIVAYFINREVKGLADDEPATS